MKKMLMNNWPLKLLSLAAAFFIWLSVVSYTDPVSTYTISNIPIEFENADLIRERGMSVTVEDRAFAAVTVTTSRTTYAGLSADDFRAVADYKDMYQDTQVPVKVTCMTGKVKDSEINLLTRSIEVSLEPLKEVTVPIECETSGEPASGYALGTVTVTPEVVTVQAPESFAQLVRRAVVRIDVSGISETLKTTAEVEYYDGNGLLLDLASAVDTTTSLTGRVDVEAQVMAVQSVSITPTVRGVDAVASGYRYTGVEISPEKLNLFGLKADMNQISTIEVTEGLDVTGASGNVVVEVDVRSYLPEGVTVYGDNYMVTFTLKVEPLVQREFTLDTSTLQVNDIPDRMTYAIQQHKVSITVSGLKADLDQLEQNGLKASISLRGLAAGEHSVLVVPILSGNGYEQVGTSQVLVVLTDPDSSSAEETTPSESPEETTDTTETGSEAPEEPESSSEESAPWDDRGH